MADIKEIDTISNYKKKFLTFLKFEVHFLKFQIIETLFSFIFALEKGDDIDLWFNLSFPRNISDRSFAVFLVKSGNTAEALDYYQKSLDTGDEEYEFTAETREKIKKYKSKLN